MRLTTALAFAALCWLIGGCELAPAGQPQLAAAVVTSASASQPGTPRLVKHTRKYLYGLNIEPPWADGGFIEANLPEHLQVCPAGTEIVGEAEGDGPSKWVVADGGRSATLDVTSASFPGVRARCEATVKGKSIVFTLRVDNTGKTDLPLLKVLACHRYRKLAGFAPGPNPLTHTFVKVGGKLTRLADVPTTKPEAIVKGAFVTTRAERDPSISRFTSEFGGYYAPRRGLRDHRRRRRRRGERPQGAARLDARQEHSRQRHGPVLPR